MKKQVDNLAERCYIYGTSGGVTSMLTTIGINRITFIAIDFDSDMRDIVLPG